MKKKIRLALVGAGGIGKIWAEAIKKTEGVELVVVVDVNLAAAKAIEETFLQCIVTSDWKDVLKDKSVDALLVATPHKFLAPISLAALKAGKMCFARNRAG